MLDTLLSPLRPPPSLGREDIGRTDAGNKP